MFVRRYAIQFADFQNTHLFYAIPASEDTLFQFMMALASIEYC